ncbi:MAG: rod shape-determining protein MreD [Clostridia bacterium]|nr:rod shape-determining protein MreD [Clostridia bacterium]
MKKTLINVFLIITAIIIYYLQSNLFMWFNIAGVKPNLFVVLALFIGLFANRTMGIAYGVGIGIIVDILIGKTIGIYAISLGITGFLAAVFDKNFSKDSRMTIIFMVVGSTIIFEIINYLLNYMILGINVEITNFTMILAIEVIYNIVLTIILYSLIQKLGYYIENEYKGNKILTRYF